MNPILFMFIASVADGYVNNGLLSISITRHHKGDIFIAQGETCYQEFCVGLSAGTATPTEKGRCECQCASNRPVFRDDLNICVNDIQECSLVPFASSSAIKKIPYVFLPLKGQIVYPSAEIIISEIETPVCVVSGGQFLGQSGWLNLRNNSNTEPPFRLFRDEGRTYLQWLGESSLRMAMEGRIILVHLMCKDASANDEPKIVTPCIAFRVAGNPSMREVMFATDIHLKEETSGTLSVKDYIAIGTCSLLLALVYIAAIFLYLHIRRRKQKKGSRKIVEDAQLTLGEEGVIKNNPLLQATRHLSQGGQDNAGYISDSNSCCSDADQTSDLLCLEDDDLIGPQNMQTSAIIHPCEMDYGETTLNQDSSNIEKLPEENVSIVETLEAKDENSETIKGMGCPNGRRKLYFNPSYFEPDLLKAPPPAAVEFLTKIREVIAIAKHKMSAKKFSPSLIGIPEEDGSSKTGYGSVLSLRKSTASEKSETKKTPKPEIEKPQPNFHIVPNELYCPSDSKQKIIRKWLEDVPVMILQNEGRKSPHQKVISEENKILNKSKLWQLNEASSNKTLLPTVKPEKKRPSTKPKAPPLPPLKTEKKIERTESVKSESGKQKDPIPEVIPPRPPPLPVFNFETEIPRVLGKEFVPPNVAKNLMDAVIQELTSYKNHKIGKETKQVDKENEKRDESPEEKEDTNAAKTYEAPPQDDHEYEVILLNADPPPTEGKDLKIYNLPEILSKNDRTEGYSLVSEVYVNDSYSYCSGESSPSNYSTLSADSEQVHYDMPVDNTGRLTIHVTDSPDRYKTAASESDSFEPDTLDRKPCRNKVVKRINQNGVSNHSGDEYCNQKFHNDCSTNANEQFTDSLERPSIMLRTNGTFKRNLEKDIDDLFRNFNWNRAETVVSLREIYEAKTKNNKTGTRSLIDTTPDHERMSTLSYSEDRRNKLLHHGIVLHIEEPVRKHRRSSPKILPRPPKPPSRSGSPAVRSNCTSPSLPVSPRSISPPVPPPRSVPASPPPRSPCSPPPVQPRSTSCSPIPSDRHLPISPIRSPSNSLQRSHKSNTPLRTSPIPPTCSSPPPRPPKPTAQISPLLPPRNKPPLPPKTVKRQSKPTPKFPGRPLPPLPRTNSTSSPYKDLETLSTTSMDSLNSSEYEAFYTLPYEENDETESAKTPPNGIKIRSQRRSTKERRNGHQRREKTRGSKRDSGYLSTDSNDSFCHNQMLFSTHFSRISENGSQNSETEESLCDGASESGGESIATDSFFYGNFKLNGKSEGHKGGRDGYPYSMRLSDVEVNSDSERHCVPIMVRP